MKRWKSIIGIVLILCAVGGLVLWELKGRQLLLMETVYVAKEAVPMGTVAGPEQFAAVPVLRENLVEGALKEGRSNRFIGRITAQNLCKNQQITEEIFCERGVSMTQGKAIFVIKPEWIDARSSALRKGDTIHLYSAEGSKHMGTYPVAFVKDAEEREVRNDALVRQDYELERTDSTSKIDHIEIIASLKDYENIRSYASSITGGSLLLVQAERGKESEPRWK